MSEPILMPCPLGLPYNTAIDLHDPSVRDAVVRWMWARLRPGEPEPLTAPRWEWDQTPTVPRRWMLTTVDGDYRRYAKQVYAAPGTRNNDAIIVPALADVPLDHEDRDLLALRCCALAVAGGAR